MSNGNLSLDAQIKKFGHFPEVVCNKPDFKKEIHF